MSSQVFGLRNKESCPKFVFKCDVFSLIFCIFILKRQRGRIHFLYSRSSLYFKNDSIFIFLKYQRTLNECGSKSTLYFIKNVHVFK